MYGESLKLKREVIHDHRKGLKLKLYGISLLNSLQIAEARKKAAQHVDGRHHEVKTDNL
jgi:hypothetical protein